MTPLRQEHQSLENSWMEKLYFFIPLINDNTYRNGI